MKLSEYIEVLQQRLDELGGRDIEVVMTQSGYYSDGTFADLYDVPEFKEINIAPYNAPENYQQFLVAGHSHQSY